MLLVDAIYINNGGGKVLLDYLIEELKKTDCEVFFLFDKRCDNFYLDISFERKKFIEPSILQRHLFYLKNKNRFKKVLCFGNIPPSIKLKRAEVYTYFHQPLFLKIPKTFSAKNRVVYSLKIAVLNLFKRNTTTWLVQSNFVKEALSSKYNINKSRVRLLPFYPPIELSETKDRNNSTFIYVSNASVHKNHKNLIYAFCDYYDRHGVGKLILTVSPNTKEVFDLITLKTNEGYPIDNVGFVSRNKLSELYAMSEYLIFPSLAESFGLGILEALESGCKIIGSDLPYTYAVCNPSIIFAPLEVGSIVSAFEESQKNIIEPSEQLVFNEIKTLLSLLK